MNSEVVVFKSGANFQFSVHIDGLDSLMRFLSSADPKLCKAMQDGLKEAAQPVLAKAKAKASAIADDGTYASSMSLQARSSGKVVLRASDPAAGVKEFAHPGARTISSKGTPRANSRLRMHSGVGVPRRAGQPRAIIPAAEESVEEVRSRIDAKLEEVLNRG